MASDSANTDADAYYGSEEIDGGEIDLSFLDEDAQEDKK